jgi:hypothetical protein
VVSGWYCWLVADKPDEYGNVMHFSLMHHQHFSMNLLRTFNADCDFTPTFFINAFLPSLFENKASVYPHS